ncbi:TniQ family protein [Microbacterium oxydans]|nr:TniQ family protein [Microbacterium oxydans]
MTSRPGLPTSVRLYPGETAASYWARLCAANAIGEKDLWLALRREDRTLPIRVTPRSALRKIEALGGLPDGALLREAGGRACGHGGATRQVECPSCRMIPAAVALCRRCARGDQVTVARMHGPVCVRHRRWHGSGRDIPLPGRASTCSRNAC